MVTKCQNAKIHPINLIVSMSTSSENISTVEPFEAKSEEEFEEFHRNRVFINHLDCYHGKHFAKILSSKIFRDRSEAAGDLGEGGEEAVEETSMSPKDMQEFSTKETYHVVGTAKMKSYQATEDIDMILSEENEEKFMADIMRCGFIIYDITNDPDEIPKASSTLQKLSKKLEELKEKGPKKFSSMNEQRVFVLISPIMTWAKTRPVDPEDPDVPFVETDFRKRKPHPNYKSHLDLEKEVIAIGKKLKEHLLTIVIATGSTYGEEEQDFHFLFKLAWQNKEDLPIINPGNNTIPVINIKDLISVIYGVFEHVPKKPKYIVAVEQTPCTQKQIVKILSKKLGNGRFKTVTKEESFLYPQITQTTHERLSVNLKMEPNFIVNDLEIPWQSDLNFVENIDKIVKEFKESRKLYPLNVILHGPPAVGKTIMSKKIAEYYGLHYISVRTLIDETLASLRANIQYVRAQMESKAGKDDTENEEEAAEEEDEDEDLESAMEEYTEKLKGIERGLEESENGKLPDVMIIQLLRDKLQSNDCQNHGYVLDGYPKTVEQTKELFEIVDTEDAEEADAEEEGDDEEPKKYILPHFVITLEASDDFLCNRVMHMPEILVQDTHYTEEHMVRRLNEFHINNTDEDTMLDVFDEREIHPYSINAETDDIESIFALIQAKIGQPFGYPPSEEELEQKRLEEEERQTKEAEELKLIREEQEKLAKEEHERNMELWAELLQQLQHEEEQQLTAQCKPLREYLVRFVFPTLTRGLLETARVKPLDPVDFLAEYLFKENPEGRMFDPAFAAAADDLFKTIEQFQERLGD